MGSPQGDRPHRTAQEYPRQGGNKSPNVEELMKINEVLTGRPLVEGLGVAVLIGLCVMDRKGQLELATQDKRCCEVREESCFSSSATATPSAASAPHEWASTTMDQTLAGVGPATLAIDSWGNEPQEGSE